MAIQKINLGTEPLGEGGDTYRSANTKINENFSNTTHAASRLVGTSPNNVMQVGAFGVGNIAAPAWSDFKEVADTYVQGICSGGMSLSDSLSNLPPKFRDKARTLHFSFSNQFYPTGLFIQAGSPTIPPQLAFYGEGTKVSEGNIQTVLHTGNTKKDSRTNLLLESGESIPSNSAASKLVGTDYGNVLQVGAFGLGPVNPDRIVETSELSSDDLKSDQENANILRDRIFTANKGTGFYYSPVSFKMFGSNVSPSLLIKGGDRLAWLNIDARSVVTVTYGARTGDVVSSTIYGTSNTTVDSNKNIKTSSPVVRVFSDHLDKIHEANDLPIKYTRNGVGDYTIEGTTGLRENDWQIVIPEDDHRNQLIAFTIEEDNGTIRLKTYKRTFSMETFTFGPDLSAPLDIPEGRWVDLHFNDLPEELLEEPEPEVEEPTVDEEAEPEEAVEEPSEESK